MASARQTAYYYYDSCQYPHALTALKDALIEDPDDIGLLNMLAVTFAELKQFELANQIITRALSLDPNFAHTVENCAFIYLSQGNLIEAAKHLDNLITLDPQNYYVHLLFAVLEEQRQNYLKMRDYAYKATKLNPTAAEALEYYAKAQIYLDQTEDARDILQAALALNPEDSRLHRIFGQLSYESGDPEKAYHSLKEALRLNPHNLSDAELFIEALKARKNIFYGAISDMLLYQRGKGQQLVQEALSTPFTFLPTLVVILFANILKELATLIIRFDKSLARYISPEIKRANTRNLLGFLLLFACLFISLKFILSGQ
ncbi:MAG: tetratricopeptide repeat protein [Candidatus Obscuribacter phosphatis]|uniref:Tetratricopeptide repeat protein n=1 Tax=Candidatus Obscuribacter phosphatis TaxID=1906157 RepID=A0A8J7P8I2_9BACT|nr:tetratricopeptide repeat protein [Candidatus Obscuribacter phosphatis]